MAALLAVALGGCLEGEGGRPAGQQCTADSSCQSPLVCRYGRCRPLCTFDRDCPPGEVCIAGEDPSERVCTVAEEHEPGECPAGMIWLEGEAVCREPCADGTSPCPPGYHCLQNVDGRLVCVDEAVECLAYMAVCIETTLTLCADGRLVSEPCPRGCTVDDSGGHCL